MRFSVAFALLALLTPSLYGQLNNFAFENRMKVEEADSSKLFLGLNVLGFGKNNEYSKTIIDGYTLFGYQLNPHLSFNLSKNVRIDAGVYAQKDFGNDDYTEVAPTFSIKYQKKNIGVVFGTLESSLNHRLIEPLYDFERVLNRRLENGIQFLWMKEDLFLDTWVDWQNMIYFNDADKEEFTFGLSLNKTLFKNNSIRIDLPVQFLAHHFGGQIDVNPSPVVTTYNGAAGIDFNLSSASLIKEWGVKSYLIFYKDDSSVSQFYEDGYGIYINPYVSTKFGLTLMGNYWLGNEFISFQGGTLYPSFNEQYPTRSDEVRQLVMLRFLYDLKLTDHLVLTARAEPLYDSYSKSIQYSFGLYLNFYDRFFLLHAKKNR